MVALGGMVSIREQVEQLEALRVAGRIDDAWYQRAKAQLVRRYRAERSGIALRSTQEIVLDDSAEDDRISA